MKRLTMILLLVFLTQTVPGCGPSPAKRPPGNATVSGKLIIFHAGSLSVPFKEICAAFNRKYPGVRIERETAGSRTCARKIVDLHRPCDVMASADYTVIDTLLIPGYADWNIRFAANEMVIAYRAGSAGAGQVTADNWYEILMRRDVAFGRSDPNTDPCGYRTVQTIELAGLYYKKPGLAARMLKKDLKYIRPKEVELLALLDAREIDYMFVYRSVARQHGLKYLILPDRINLKQPELAGYYSQAAVRVTGRKPGTFIVKRGAPMVYGVTIPKNAPNPKAALAFVTFLLEKENGMVILEKNGQPSVIPSPTATFDKIPPALKKFARGDGK